MCEACTIQYIGHASHKLQCIFSQAQIKTFQTAPNKQETQDKAGVYRIPCECCISSGRPATTYLHESRNIKHTADWDTWKKNQPSSNNHKNKNISSTGSKPSSSHQSSSGTNAELGSQSRSRHTIHLHTRHRGFFIIDIWSPLLKQTLPAAALHNNDTLQLHTSSQQPTPTLHLSRTTWILPAQACIPQALLK